MEIIKMDELPPNETQQQNMLKIMIIGNSGVGKTCFLMRYFDDVFSEEFNATVGIDFKAKTIVRNERDIKLQVWDSAGQERYRSLTRNYCRNTMGFVLVYDVTKEQSFISVAYWADEIISDWRTHQVILVGNKIDIPEERTITYDQGKKLADSYGFLFIETSAKNNINVESAFEKLVDHICEHMKDRGTPLLGDVQLGRSDGSEILRLQRKGCMCSQ